MWTLCDTKNKCLFCATVYKSMHYFMSNECSLYGRESLLSDQYSLGDLERLKVVLIKGQETTHNVSEKGLSLTSSIYQTASLSITQWT